MLDISLLHIIFLLSLIFGSGYITNQLVRFYLDRRNAAREAKIIRYRMLASHMIAYINPNFDGINYDPGSKKTKEGARARLVGWYYADCLIHEKISLIRSLSDFIKEPNDNKLVLILNEIRQEVGSKNFNKEIAQELAIKITLTNL